jgi:acyl carrier protein
MRDAPVDIIALFQAAAQEVVGHELENLTLETELSDLALDSVAVMEIVGFVEQRLEVRFADEDLARLTTLGNFATLVEKARRARTAPHSV